MNINERIQEIIRKLFNGNKSAFSKRIEIKPTTLSNITRKEKPANPSSDILERIIKNIPEINAYWLVIGQGEMLKRDTDGGINLNSVGSGIIANAGTMSNVNPYPNNVVNDGMVKDDKDQKILLLENEVKHLNELLAEKERIIQVLLKNS